MFWDVDAVSGLFIRPEISLRIPLLTHLPIHLHHFELIIGSLVTTVGAGIAVDEKLDPGNPSVAGYYEDDGLTHVDWSLTFPVGVDVWLLKIIANPYVSVQLNVDPQTQIVGLLGGDIDRDRKWTGGFALVVELPRCRPTRGLCH